MVVVLGLALLGEVAIGLDAVLEAVELPARVCDLATGLADWTRSGLARVQVAAKAAEEGQRTI